MLTHTAQARTRNRFESKLDEHRLVLRRGQLQRLQINVGRKCNQTCTHCHVDAAPWRTEMMPANIARRVGEWIREHCPPVVDITGGAPELSEHFRYFVESAREAGCQVIDRNNLTIIETQAFTWLPEYLAAHEVEVVASLPCYSADNVDAQRGDGVFAKSISALKKAPVLEIALNRTNMTRYNVHASEVNKVVATALGGAKVGAFIEGNRRYDIVVRMPEDLREKIEHLDRLPLRTSDGGLIPLGKVANLSMAERVGTIHREAGQRRAALLVNLRGRDVQSWVTEAQQKLAAQVKLPDGYYFEFGGQFKNLQAARTRLMIVVPLVLAIIFVLIFAAFGSLRQALVIYSGIPLAVTGGVFALVLRGLPFSISAGVGFIALSGVAVLNGVVLITYFNQLRAEGKGVLDSVLEGSLTRLRPVLMTALVASLGFVPMAIATGSGSEVQRPLATVVIGGILSSTFLTLLLLPVLYAWAEKKTKPQTTKTPKTP